MYNKNEKPLGMSDDEWEDMQKKGFFQQCPENVKNALRKQGIQMTDEEHDQIWQELPEYFAYLRKQQKNKKYITMFTPEGFDKISQCVNIVKTMAKLINEDIHIEFYPIETIIVPKEPQSQLLIVTINEIKFGNDVVDGECGNLLSQLNEIASTVSLSVDYSGENISMHINIDNAVIVKEL